MGHPVRDTGWVDTGKEKKKREEVLYMCFDHLLASGGRSFPEQWTGQGEGSGKGF